MKLQTILAAVQSGDGDSSHASTPAVTLNRGGTGSCRAEAGLGEWAEMDGFPQPTPGATAWDCGQRRGCLPRILLLISPAPLPQTQFGGRGLHSGKKYMARAPVLESHGPELQPRIPTFPSCVSLGRLLTLSELLFPRLQNVLFRRKTRSRN